MRKWLSDACADVVILLSTWLVAQLTRDGADFRTLYSQPALRGLVVALALWAGVWASRYLSTGNLEPPPPAQQHPAPPPQPQPAPLPPQPPQTGSSAVTSYTPPPFPPGTSVTSSVTGAP